VVSAKWLMPASRHWVLGERTREHGNVGDEEPGHKCLSALGSWGTPQWREVHPTLSHKCLSALGSWGTSRNSPRNAKTATSHKCLSALGSWGTASKHLESQRINSGHKCLSALGSWGTPDPDSVLSTAIQSQMPLGIGFLGNPHICEGNKE